MAAVPPACEFGWPAPDFSLPGVDGSSYDLARAKGPNGLVVAFICNHCPYVIAIAPRLARDFSALQAQGIGLVAINANDAKTYPQDSFENMQRFAKQYGFAFPYLYDESQSVAKAYGAVCTPDFFGFNAQGALQYRGRLDASRAQPAGPDAARELVEAMTQIAQTGQGPKQQNASMGCSIKWK